MKEKRRILVVGATGGIGSEVARAALDAGWHVRAMHRSPKKGAAAVEGLTGVEWVKGDAMRKRDVARAAIGCEVLFHGANPPGYRKWRQRAVPMLENTIRAAEKVGAMIAFPGNVYNFGDDAFPVLTEQSPQSPRTEKGRIRVEMEHKLEKSAAPVLLVRAGDFFGPHAPGSWLGAGMISAGKPLRSVTYPGGRTTLHSFAYLPDLAATFIRLLTEKKPRAFDVYHFAGHTVGEGVDFADVLRKAAGAPDIPVKKLPWTLLRLVGLFSETLREVSVMRYLWSTPHRLDNTRLVEALGVEPHTPLDVALRQTLVGHGCLQKETPATSTRKAAAAGVLS